MTCQPRINDCFNLRIVAACHRPDEFPAVACGNKPVCIGKPGPFVIKH
jgi:hypothetical protein